jgi:dTDP-4-dehydrorhamnose 3,5-epimerase
MKIEETNISGLKIIHPKIFNDDRGYFFESYNQRIYKEAGLDQEWIQDNQSKSVYGVVRGLHYQLNPYAQSKLVRVLQGSIFDVAIDIRKDSPTFGHWHGLEISEENKLQFLIPEGFAHGFSVLSETTIVLYKCNQFYHPEAERGIIYNEALLNIDWLIPGDKILISDKDQKLPGILDAEINFTFKA